MVFYRGRNSPYAVEDTINTIRADDLMMLRSSIYGDSQLASSLEATSAIAQHNSSTPLLKLPQEIKNEIYELVCGRQLLHIGLCWANNQLKFTSQVCHTSISEDAAEDWFHADSTTYWFVPQLETRHYRCFVKGEPSEKVNPMLLATCRQVYNEAQHIPYTTNTFSFRRADVFEEFTKYLKNSGSVHNLKIRGVHFTITTTNFNDERRWNHAIAQYLIPHFPAVQQIAINLEQWLQEGVVGCRTPAEFEARQSSGQYFMDALLQLRQLPLKQATFVICDSKILFGNCSNNTHPKVTPYRWTLAEKQVWARYVKDFILRKDNQRATPSSGAAVETATHAEKMALLGVESSGEEKGDGKLENQEEDVMAKRDGKLKNQEEEDATAKRDGKLEDQEDSDATAKCDDEEDSDATAEL